MENKPGAANWHDDLVALLPRVRRFALSLTGSIDDAEDLLHSTIEKALLKAHQFKDGTDLDRWLFTICKNLWFDTLRQRKVRGPSVDPEDHKYEPAFDGERDAVAHVQLGEFERAMQELKEEYRVVLELVVIEGYAYKEAAAMLDVPVGTIMSRLSRARAKLQSLLPQEAASSASRLRVIEGDKP